MWALLKKRVIHPIKRLLAKYYLFLLRNLFGLKVIGITGSAGKTTTKEMVASILSKDGKTIASCANIDPVYNIPTTILRCRPSTKYLVLEMGVEYPGEMDFYLWLVRPDIGVITNIYPTHLLFFKSVEGVLGEKRKLVRSFNKDGLAVLNAGNPYLRKLEKKIKAKVVWFGDKRQVRAKNIRYSNDFKTTFTLIIDTGEEDIRLPILGKQFVENALAAASVGFCLGLSIHIIKEGLQTYRLPEHRMKVIKLKNGSVVFDDSYNNNPEAAKNALKIFHDISRNKKTVVVMGDMLELGKDELKYHIELGKQVSKYRFNYLIGVGKASFNVVKIASKYIGEKHCWWLENRNGVLKVLKPLLRKNTLVLIKGSRSIGLDQVVSRL